MLRSARRISVHDPTRAGRDPALPSLASALDPARAAAELGEIPALADDELAAIRVVRHKPGRRCLVAYDFVDAGTVYGKVQRRRYGKSGYRLLRALCDAGVPVPEPVGVVGAFRMWLQREAPGVPATAFLDSVELARRVADAAHQLHRAGVTPDRRHGVDDELRILEQCFAAVEAERPELRPRLTRLLRRCRDLAPYVADAPVCGIHRDFYADQVLVDGPRLTLVDFDLYCLGDAALDIGNFVGHVTEQALRERGSPTAYVQFEGALQRRFAELAGDDAAARVPVWAALTLARHVYLSTRFADRRAHTEQLLELAEARVAEAA